LGPDAQVEAVWHTTRSLDGFDAVVLPGGFSWGDYLRCGAIARFAPVMQAVGECAERGVPVLGICNGFQVLLEAGLLPGALVRNDSLRFRCDIVACEVVSNRSIWTSGLTVAETVRLPIAHGEGRYVADDETLAQLIAEDRVVLRYSAENPNGSLDDIAGISNEAGNVVGMMPHPERAVHDWMGSADGRSIVEGVARVLIGA
jgi:phosphoribosylformylglycinamidine synthase